MKQERGFKKYLTGAKIDNNKSKGMAEKYGFREWRIGQWCIVGGIISCCSFEYIPNPKYWKKVSDKEFIPKRNTNIGRAISEDFLNLPLVMFKYLSDCIGEGIKWYNVIGFSCDNDYFFGISMPSEWGVGPP